MYCELEISWSYYTMPVGKPCTCGQIRPELYEEGKDSKRSFMDSVESVTDTLRYS